MQMITVPKAYDIQVSIGILGDSGVGKTNILNRFCRNNFELGGQSTIGVDFLFKDVIVDDKKVRLRLIDTAGQDKYLNITRNYYNSADGIVLVYSVTDRQSYANIKEWLERVKESCRQDTPIILVSNKNDNEFDRKVTKADGVQLAKMFGLQYFAVSAKTGQEINKVFEVMASETKKRHRINISVSHISSATQQKSMIHAETNKCKC